MGFFDLNILDWERLWVERGEIESLGGVRVCMNEGVGGFAVLICIYLYIFVLQFNILKKIPRIFETNKKKQLRRGDQHAAQI